ncbi:MAG: hypothetical protein IKI93_07835 [Clostridia bacterium]|nr:hypothetical protein [Clostridia bacterium]
MKTILIKSGIVLCMFALAVLYLFGLHCADGTAPFDLSYRSSSAYYTRYLIEFIIIGLSGAWFLQPVSGGLAVHPYRWCRLLPAVIGVRYIALYIETDGHLPTDPELLFEFITALLYPLILAAAGLLITRIVLGLRNGAAVWLLILQGMTVGFLLALICYSSSLIEYNPLSLESILRFFLPVVFWKIGIVFTHLIRKKETLQKFLYPTYFLTVSVLTTLSSLYYNSQNIFTYHPVNLMYLIFSAVLVLYFTQDEPFGTWFFRIKSRKIYESPLFLTLFMSIILFASNERFMDVISTWNEPLAPVYGDSYALHFPNWFSYRVTVLVENLTRSIESIQILNASRIPKYNSAAWLYQIFGILPVLIVLALLTGVFLLLRQCVKNSGRFHKYLYSVLLLRTVLGLLANLLLVYSTDITPLMMGLIPYDVIYIIMILSSKENP